MEFWKMNGAGNDFILLNNMDGGLSEDLFPYYAKTLCERHLSIGADGMMVVSCPQNGGDYRMMFYNSDGTMGEMCGNGARCICRYGFENGLAGEIQHVETTAGLVVGYRVDARNYRIRLNDYSVFKPEKPIEIDGTTYLCDYVELGNPGIPHAVVEIPGLKEYDHAKLFELGKALRWNKAFPKGANVNFYTFAGEGSVYIKTFERGVEDFTYACGTGTGSTALALTLKGKINGHLDAAMRGGLLHVDVDMENGSVKNLWLTGPTNIVCKGEITDENM